jgi:hypothetical protein
LAGNRNLNKGEIEFWKAKSNRAIALQVKIGEKQKFEKLNTAGNRLE